MQGSRVNSPSSATLQAPGLPYTCGPYLGFLAATLLLLRGGRRRRIRAARVRAQRWTRVGERCSSVACAISRAEQVALATCREWQRGKTAKAVGGPRVESVVKSTWNSHLPALLHARTEHLFRAPTAPKPRMQRGRDQGSPAESPWSMSSCWWVLLRG